MLENGVIFENENDQYRLRIEQDEYPDNPREWDNLSTMVCWHRRYGLGDKHNYKTPEDFYFSLAEELVGDTDKVNEMSSEEIEALVLTSKELVIMPLYLLDHSGLTISTSCIMFSAVDSAGWDWGQVGWAYITMDKMREEFGDISDEELREQAEEIIEDEVEIYNDYLNGNVYSFILERKAECDKCGHVEYEVVDACGGFYGSDYEEQIRDVLGPEYRELLPA